MDAAQGTSGHGFELHVIRVCHDLVLYGPP